MRDPSRSNRRISEAKEGWRIQYLICLVLVKIGPELVEHHKVTIIESNEEEAIRAGDPTEMRSFLAAAKQPIQKGPFDDVDWRVRVAGVLRLPISNKIQSNTISHSRSKRTKHKISTNLVEPFRFLRD